MTRLALAFLLVLAAFPAHAAPSRSDARLRSAYLQDAAARPLHGGVPRDSAREELRLHFFVVEDLLVAATEASVGLALSRLESHLGVRFNPEARARYAEELRRARWLQIVRLREYRERAVFPLNERLPGRAVPLFVDAHDTACAVGHLMRLAGLSSAVAEIARTNLTVRVPEVKGGPLFEWVLRSGLTQEEAALIQPGYAPPTLEATLTQLLGPTPPTLSSGTPGSPGLLFEHFTFSVTDETGPTPVDLTTSAVLERTGAATGRDDFESGGAFLEMSGTDWLFFGAPAIEIVNPIASAVPGQVTVVRYGFDVTTVDPLQAVSASFFNGVPWFNQSNAVGLGGLLGVETRVLVGGQVVATLVDAATSPVAGDFLFPVHLQAGEAFAPQRQVRLETEVRLSGPASYESIFHQLTLVPIPEPGTLWLCAAGVLGLAALRRRG